MDLLALQEEVTKHALRDPDPTVKVWSRVLLMRMLPNTSPEWERYLDDLHVKYVIGFAGTDEGTLRKLEAAGFREEMTSGEFVLWSRALKQPAVRDPR